MSGRKVRKGTVEDPLEVHNKKHELGDHHIHRESEVKLTRVEDKGKVKVAFQPKEYQKFTHIRIYQAGDPHPPKTILPELPPRDPRVRQLHSFRSPDFGYRWAMFLMNFDPKFGADFRTEFTIEPHCKETLIQYMTVLVTYAERDFSDTPKNYFDLSLQFQGRTFP